MQEELPPSSSQPVIPGATQIEWINRGNDAGAARTPGPLRAYESSPPATEHVAPTTDEAAQVPTVEGDLMNPDGSVDEPKEVTKKLFDEGERQPTHIDETA